MKNEPLFDVTKYGFELFADRGAFLEYKKDVGNDLFLTLSVSQYIFSLESGFGKENRGAGVYFNRFSIHNKEDFEFILKRSFASHHFKNLL